MIVAQFAITTIEPSKTVNGYYYFHGDVKEDIEDKDAVVLKDVETTDEENVYRGKVVSAKDAGEQIAAIITSSTVNPNMADNDAKEKKIMLIIHGNLVQPEFWLEETLPEAQNRMPEYLVIPVIWPTVKGGLTQLPAYNKNYWHAHQAGIAFRDAAKDLKEITGGRPINIMGHSLGNRFLAGMLEDGPIKDLNVDQIFMAAADIWDETFNENVVRGPENHEGGFKKDVGLHILNQAKKNVHVLHNRYDDALQLSNGVNGFDCRLGQFGSIEQTFYNDGNRLCPEAADKIIDHNFQEFDEWGSLGHDYHLGPRACRIYENYMDMDCTPNDIFEGREYYIKSVCHGTYLRAIAHDYISPWSAEVEGAIQRDENCKFKIFKTVEEGVKGTKFKLFSHKIGAYVHFNGSNDVEMKTGDETGYTGWFTIREVPPKIEDKDKKKYVIVGMYNGNHMTLKDNKDANQQYHHGKWEEYYLIEA